jgi:hypothetical protein
MHGSTARPRSTDPAQARVQIPLFLAGILGCTACSTIAADSAPRATVSVRRGPIPERANGPLAQTFLVLRPRAAATTAPGVFDLRAQSAYSSIFEVGAGAAGAVSFDGELWRTSVAGRAGLGPRTDFEVEVPFLCASSGFLDVFIETWHAILGLPDQGRETRPRFDYDMQVSAGGEVAFRLEGDRLQVGDVPLVLTHRVADETRGAPAVFVQVALELPVGDEDDGFGNGGLDAGLAAGVEKSFGDWTFGGGLAWIERNRTTAFGAAGLAVEDGLHARIDAEWRWVPESSVLLGLRYEPEISDSLGIEELGGPVVELDLALAIDGAWGTRWMAGFSEDVLSQSGPDFTVFAGVAVSF